MNRNSTVVPSALVSERSVKLKKTKVPQGWGLFAKFYSDPFAGRVGVNALVGSQLNSNKNISLHDCPLNFCEPSKRLYPCRDT